MIRLVILGNVALPILYGIVFLAYGAAFLSKEEKRTGNWTGLLLPAAVVHGLYLAARTSALGHMPMLSRYEAMTTIAFCVVLFYLLLERQVKIRAVGVFIIGPAFLLQLISSTQIQHVIRAENPQFEGFLFRFHVVTSILAYVGFAVAAFYGILYLLLFREIRSRKLSFVFSRLPALETLSRMNYRAVLLAFVLFTLGLVAGIAWAYQVIDGFTLLDPKQVGTFVIWILYAALLAFSSRGRWQGRNGAILSLVGFASILAVFVALNLVFHSFHDYL